MKEELVQLIQAEGYDFMTACIMANRIMKETKGTTKWYIGKTKITIRKD